MSKQLFRNRHILRRSELHHRQRVWRETMNEREGDCHMLARVVNKPTNLIGFNGFAGINAKGRSERGRRAALVKDDDRELLAVIDILEDESFVCKYKQPLELGGPKQHFAESLRPQIGVQAA